MVEIATLKSARAMWFGSNNHRVGRVSPLAYSLSQESEGQTMRRSVVCFAIAAASSLCLLTSCASSNQGRSREDLSTREGAAVSQVDTSVNFHTEITVDSAGTPGRIDGTIISAQSGKPLQGVIVYLRVNGAYRLPGVATDTAGKFQFVRDPEAEVQLESRFVGYRWEFTTLDTRTAVTAKIALRVTRVVIQY
jgi:hypothetical protein